jgi:hypothetical protein
MKTQIYNIDGSWFYLNVYVKQNNTYWIDWEECEIINFKAEIMSNKNILCVNDDKYFYYDTNNLTYHYLEDKKLSLCVDNIKCLSNLKLLNAKYENKFVFIYNKYLFEFF